MKEIIDKVVSSDISLATLVIDFFTSSETNLILHEEITTPLLQEAKAKGIPAVHAFLDMGYLSVSEFVAFIIKSTC
jgi:hypothetical protein